LTVETDPTNLRCGKGASQSSTLPPKCLQHFRGDDGLVHICDKRLDHGTDHLCEIHRVGADLDRDGERRILR